MKRIWAMWHVMVEPFDDVACYGVRFRWEAISMFHSLFWMRDPPRYRVGLMDPLYFFFFLILLSHYSSTIPKKHSCSFLSFLSPPPSSSISSTRLQDDDVSF
ncbi:hypothetical protein Hanom_Chr00s147696g01820941 [Helianthus anomalus]